MRVGRSIWINAAAFFTAALLAFACAQRYPPTPTRCLPSDPNPCLSAANYSCCSDDPAALDLANLDDPVLPAYLGRQGSGAPLFSADRNASSHSGVCVREGNVPPANALEEPAAKGCPTPCNPDWSTQELALICGPNTICCQTEEIEVSDCVLDPALGSTGCWRPVHGGDVEGLGGLDATNWAESDHATLQDPGGFGCDDFVSGLSDTELSMAGVSPNEVMSACVRRLSVANRRGFCMGGAGVNQCPYAQPSYRDACEQINDAEGRDGCG